MSECEFQIQTRKGKCVTSATSIYRNNTNKATAPSAIFKLSITVGQAKGIGIVRQQVVFSTLSCVCEYKGSFAQCYHLQAQAGRVDTLFSFFYLFIYFRYVRFGKADRKESLFITSTHIVKLTKLLPLVKYNFSVLDRTFGR